MKAPRRRSPPAESPLWGKVALVTGGSRGIGAAVARALAAAGARVAVNYRRSRTEAEAVADTCGGIALRGDVARDADRIVDAAAKRWGRLDILVNNAGYSDPAAWTPDLEKITNALWDRVFETDVRGMFRCSRAAARVMREGAIVNVTSVPALVGEREGLVYSAAKAAVLGMTKSLAVLLAPRIRVNCMALGSVATGRLDRLTPNLLGHYRKSIPLGRFGKPEEAADLALFLATNPWVTGQTYVLDGGEARV